MNTGPVLVDVAVKDLSKLALNWAVFCAVYPGMQPTIHVAEAGTHKMPEPLKPISFPRSVRLTYTGAYEIECNWNPSGDWDCGGPLLHKYKAGFAVYDYGYLCLLAHNDLHHGQGKGPDHLTAACRAIVAALSGDIVKVPACLVLP